MSNPLADEFLRQWQPIERIARACIQAELSGQLTIREQERVDSDPSEWNLFAIDEDGVQFVQEYNDSCHCHPEWQKAYVIIPWAEIHEAQQQELSNG